MKNRKEYDSIGGINVPVDKYWGASTQRSSKYFNIGDFLVRPIVIKSIAIIKKSAAIVNFSEDHMDRYESLEKYLLAKLRILRNAPVAVLNKDDRVLKEINYKGKLIGFGMTEPEANDYGLISSNGSHYLSRGNRKILESKW